MKIKCVGLWPFLQKAKKGLGGNMGASFSLFRKTLFCGNFATFFLWGAIWPSFFYECNLKKKLKRLNVEITKVRTSIPQVQFYSAEILDICNSKKERKVFNCFFGGGRNLPQISNLLIFFLFFSTRFTYLSNQKFIKVRLAFVFGLQTYSIQWYCF